MEPSIIYEDNDLLVINKPSGITVNRSDTTRDEVTVQDWAKNKFSIFHPPAGGPFSIDQESDFYKRSGIVHRLDKETSGILLIAKNPDAFVALQAQFKDRTVKKIYHALAHGKITPSRGEIKVPVGRLPWNRKQFGIVAGGREAVTRYQTLKTYTRGKEILTLVELYPETGRTHQIRVHLKYIGYPIVSDFLYSGKKTSRNDRKSLSRVFLHAAKISFSHPRTNKPMEFESPLAKDLSEFIATLKE